MMRPSSVPCRPAHVGLLTAMIVTACGLVPGTGGVIREGNCTLELTDAATGRRLEGPPFALQIIGEEHAAAQLGWRPSSGWRGTVWVHTTRSDGQVVDEGGREVDDGGGDLGLPTPGVWRFLFEDERGCTMEFPVEVRPPSS